jgi:hypothetical protein
MYSYNTFYFISSVVDIWLVKNIINVRIINKYKNICAVRFFLFGLGSNGSFVIETAKGELNNFFFPSPFFFLPFANKRVVSVAKLVYYLWFSTQSYIYCG